MLSYSYSYIFSYQFRRLRCAGGNEGVLHFPCCDLVVRDAAGYCGEGATEEGMEKTADDEEVGRCGIAEADEGMGNGGMDGEGPAKDALVDFSDSRGGRGSWDC